MALSEKQMNHPRYWAMEHAVNEALTMLSEQFDITRDDRMKIEAHSIISCFQQKKRLIF